MSWTTHKSGLILPKREIQRAYSDVDYERWINRRRAPFQAPFVIPGKYATITEVSGQATGVAVVAATVNLAYPNNVTSGNLLTIGAFNFSSPVHTAMTSLNLVKLSGTATVGTIALNKTQAFNYTGSSWLDIGIWSIPVTGSGSLTLTMANATAAAISMGIDEFHSTAGSITAVAVSGNASATGSSSTLSSGNVTPPAGGQVLLIGVGIDNDASGSTNVVYTPNNSFTNIYTEPDGNNFQSGALSFKVVNGGSAATAAGWGISPGPSSWAAAVQMFQEPGAAAVNSGFFRLFQNR